MSVGPHQVELSGGEILRAPCVIDARGIGRVDGLTIGYQKFLGLVVRFERPHGQPYPIIMDATVKQRDGYRFVYTLPFTHDTMLIEDTYYSDTASIDAPTLRELCLDMPRSAAGRSPKSSARSAACCRSCLAAMSTPSLRRIRRAFRRSAFAAASSTTPRATRSRSR